MSTSAFDCATDRVEAPSGQVIFDAYIGTAYAQDVIVTGVSFSFRIRSNGSSGTVSGRLFHVDASGTQTFIGSAVNSPSINSEANFTIDLSSQTATVPAGSKLGFRLQSNGQPFRWFWGSSFGAFGGTLIVSESIAAATRTWDGGGGNDNWSTAANWVGDVAPVAGDNLVFNATGVGARPLPNNDFAAGTSFGTITVAVGGYTLSGNAVNLSGGLTASHASGSSTVSLILGGAGTATMSGAGTLVLSGSNTYTGATTIASGSTLIAAANNALGTIAGITTITSGGTLGFEGGITYSTVEPVTVNGAGVASAGAILNVSGSNSFAGNLTIGSASTFGSSAGSLAISDAFSNSGFLLTATGAGNLSFSGAISGTGGLAKNASGTLTLSGGSDNSFSGATTVSDGLLALNKSAGSDAYQGTLTVGDGTGAANSAVVRWLASTQANGGLITVNSDGLADLNGFLDTVNGLTMTAGNVTTGAGTLTLNNTVTTNAAAASATISGNLLLENDRIFNVANGAAAEDLVVSAVVSGDRAVTKQGAGLMTFSGTNTYTRATTISAGTLSVATIGDGGVAGNLGAASTSANNLVLSGGTLQYTGATASTNRDFTLTTATSSSIDVTNSGTTLTMTGASTSTTGALTKLGGGTLALSGTNLHTGTTAINAGTLLVNGSLNITSPVSLNGGTLGGSGSVGAVTSTASGGALSTGNPDTGPGILSTRNVDLSASGTRSVVVQLNGTTAGANHDQLNVTGTVNLTGATLTGTLGFAPAIGSTFTIINNDNTDAVTGTFAGLAEGATVMLSGSTFTLSYTGGTGNDVVLTSPAPSMTLAESVSPSGAQVPGTDLAFTTTFTNVGTADAQSVVITNPIPANTDFKLGSVTQDLGTTGLSVAVTYSSDGGSSWTYTPVSAAGGAPAGYDRLVTHVRWTFSGSLSPSAPNNTGTVGITMRIQ